jgi:hypothetical protein
MIEIVTVILAEYETIPFALLELLFTRIIDPEKVKYIQRRSKYARSFEYGLSRKNFVGYSQKSKAFLSFDVL